MNDTAKSNKNLKGDEGWEIFIALKQELRILYEQEIHRGGRYPENNLIRNNLYKPKIYYGDGNYKIRKLEGAE